ncbi:MAG: immunoglobulin domain-containing protein [Chitinispirillaceae bacterium]|nr:immunoglobulin domain-containing protein [Chitinispirillaceae bacterium]
MKFLHTLILLPVIVFLYCQLPADPFKKYENCTVEFTNISDSAVFYISKSVEFNLLIGNPHLIDTLTLSFDDHDTLITLGKQIIIDTLFHFSRSFLSPDTIEVKAAIVRGDRERFSASITIFILGNEPEIISQPKSFFILRPGYACTLGVKATGSDPLHYQWYKDNIERSGDTLDTLFFPYIQPADSGAYHCKVWNNWGKDSSTTSSIVVSEGSGKTVYWKFGILKDTVKEGETLSVQVKSLYIVPPGDVGTLTLLNPSSNAQFIGDSLFNFTPAKRDSGLYTIPVIVATRGGADTSQIGITILPRYFTLSLQAVSGTITAQPAGNNYRWGDLITLTAVPAQGFKFSEWSGGATGIASEIKISIWGNTDITALFIAETFTGCVELTSGSLNTAIKNASPSLKRPGSLCPQEGSYDDGTIKVWGTVRFVFQ